MQNLLIMSLWAGTPEAFNTGVASTGEDITKCYDGWCEVKQNCGCIVKTGTVNNTGAEHLNSRALFH